ncbi:MAG: hypothetical protein NXY57DRAFT_970313 [Lentinula lateritia]|nr:MAG: hypothetical protein NXY57DRAFT_970313 [Lentinula lateritia]
MSSSQGPRAHGALGELGEVWGLAHQNNGHWGALVLIEGAQCHALPDFASLHIIFLLITFLYLPTVYPELPLSAFTIM